MIAIEALFILIILLGLGITNFIVFQFSGTKQKRIFAGVIVLLLAPVVFFITFLSVAPFDPGGFGTGMISILYATLFILNGLVIIVIGVFTKSQVA